MTEELATKVEEAAGEDAPEVLAKLGDADMIEALAQIERKPPMYRMFRWGLYSSYVLVAAWLVISIAWSAWSSVYGDAGLEMRSKQLRQTRLAPQAPQ